MKRNKLILLLFLALVTTSAYMWSTRGDRQEPTALTELTAAPGWTVSRLVDAPGARDMALDLFGNLWVSQTSQGTVSLFYVKDAEPGRPIQGGAVLRNMRKPHGLAFDPEHPTALYIATETAVLELPTYSDGGPVTVTDLPVGGRHFTRSLAFGPDKRLYISIGSTCDVCREENPEHGAVISMKKDGTDRRLFATGLRNSVFLTVGPDRALWATEMGRDNLGDDLPPDEINTLKEGRNYGWPICYGQRIHDTDFDKNQYIRDPCADTEAPVIEIPAHSAPLGLAFLPGGDLLVAEHGSWNRSVPIGYKVVRYHRTGGRWVASDFLTGFINGRLVNGRPADVLVTPDGSVLVSDDKAGVIWKMERAR